MDADSESAIPNDPNAFTPDGNGTVVDNASEQEGKEFFTITASDGTVYYLVIDRQRGTQNVYFLSPVTKDDLLPLAGSGGVTSEPGITVPSAPSEPPQSEPSQPSQLEPEQPAQSGGNMGTIIFILIAVIVAGGAGYYFKIVKPRKQAAQTEEYEEYEEETEGKESDDEYFFDDAED